MALNKQAVDISFAQGLNNIVDPYRLASGNFSILENTVYDKIGRLNKRNGYAKLTALPSNDAQGITTFNGNLTAVGTLFEAYSAGSNSWVNKGTIQPLQLDTLPLVRSSTNQSQADCAIASNGLICTVFTDNVPVAGSNTLVYKYVIADSSTGQNVVAPTVIVPSAGVVTYAPRAFVLGRFFIVMYSVNNSGTYSLEYIAINNLDPTQVNAPVSITSQYTPTSTLNYDGIVANNSLYVAWNGSDGGGAIRVTSIDSTLVARTAKAFATQSADIISVTADVSNSTPTVYVSWYKAGTTTTKVLAINAQLDTVLAPTTLLSAGAFLNITSVATAGVVYVYYEVDNAYSYSSGTKTHYIGMISCTVAGAVGSNTTVVRSVGLASKAFYLNGIRYFLGLYYSPDQPSYFLINQSGKVVAKIAYGNGPTYYVTGLPNVNVDGLNARFTYLIKDTVTPVNKTQGANAPNGIYSQLGVNLVSLDFTPVGIIPGEIGNNLNLAGGLLWSYDGYAPVENGFNVFPDSIDLVGHTTGGTMTAQQYFYKVTYEWSDNQGNVFRSAPSIPQTVTTTGTTSSVTISVPTLRLTYKTANPVKIVIYRWSVAQQIYYQVTSQAIPLLNDTTTDSVQFTDILPDTSIIGNAILYTTGGVVENIGPPATKTLTLFKSRLVLVDAEDQNLLWYSKQVIENTPVEMSDLFTIYVAPTASAQADTGPISALSAMDDKLIIFKQNAIYYITGDGPDNTGANNSFSDPVFITSTVGCVNQQSIVFMPQGLMFQSDKGIWLLGRDLNTTYLGAPVSDYNSFLVKSAVNVPGTTQVRFTLEDGIVLMYDYFFGQWGSFVNVPAISSTLYQGLHTYLDAAGNVLQETPGLYLDASNPVLIKFSTGWLNLAGLQGYERAYFFYILGTYLSPHKLEVAISYDYESAPTQVTMITPDNYTPNWGGEAAWGSGDNWGGPGNIEQWRVFLQKQKCEAFQITVREVFDPSYGTTAGEGLTLSGLNLIVGTKSSYPRLRAAKSVG